MEIENDKINAEWARKIATSILGEKVKKQLDICLAHIKSAVERNEMYSHVAIYPDAMTLKLLGDRGFKCEYIDGNQRDGSYLQISW